MAVVTGWTFGITAPGGLRFAVDVPYGTGITQEHLWVMAEALKAHLDDQFGTFTTFVQEHTVDTTSVPHP